MSTYQFKISLEGAKPPIWRRVLVPPNMNFASFHLVIQAAMGWENGHLFSFFNDRRESQIGIPYDDDFMDMAIRDAAEIKLKEEFTEAKQKMHYEYDFGDGWLHQVVLEKILDETLLRPICTDGKNACPPEDCGGIWGYYDMIERANDPKSEDHEDIREWLGLDEGETWDITAFDLEEANQRLQYYLQ